MTVDVEGEQLLPQRLETGLCDCFERVGRGRPRGSAARGRRRCRDRSARRGRHRLDRGLPSRLALEFRLTASRQLPRVLELSPAPPHAPSTRARAASEVSYSQSGTSRTLPPPPTRMRFGGQSAEHRPECYGETATGGGMTESRCQRPRGTALTISGSNWVPAFRRISARASSTVRSCAVRTRRDHRREGDADGDDAAARGIASPASPSG